MVQINAKLRMKSIRLCRMTLLECLLAPTIRIRLPLEKEKENANFEHSKASEPNAIHINFG